MSEQAAELHQAAVQALNRGAYERAAVACRRLLELDPRHADGWFLMGMVAAANMRVGKALELVDQAIALSAPNAEYLAQKAKLHTMLNQIERGRSAAIKAAELHPEDVLTLDTLGVVLTKTGDYAAARPLLERAVGGAPQKAQFHFNLASAAQFLGDADAADEHYRSAIERAPDFHRARWALSELHKNAGPAADARELQALLEGQELRADDELYLSHALATEHEKLGDYDAAFGVLARAKQRRASQISYSVKRDERIIEAMEKAFPVDEAPTVSASQGDNAIFITGMPRTGTTLVESILASHPEVTSLGELQDFALAVKWASNTKSKLVLDEDVVAAAGQADMQEIGADYLARLGSRLPESGRFIDKMPLNFLYIGFILQALPAAKVVCLRRNPLDTCLSNFRQLFAINFSYYNYAYDLTDTALYYVLFDRLMAHWQARFGDRIYQVKYEALTAEPEVQVRALLDYLELPWHPDCLAFHETARPVATASTMQVREPIYQHAVARWKKYDAHLADVKSIFERHGIEYEG